MGFIWRLALFREGLAYWEGGGGGGGCLQHQVVTHPIDLSSVSLSNLRWALFGDRLCLVHDAE